MKFNKWLLTGSLALIAAFASGCSDDAKTTKTESGDDVQKVLIGTGASMLNINFYHESGKLTGYDIELLRKIDEMLPQYEFEFSVMDFPNLLLSLETDKIDMISHNMAKNPDREEKFLFNSHPYNSIPTFLVVNENNEEIKSVDDLGSKKVGVVPTSNASLFIEQYVADNNLDTEIVYIPQATDIMAQLKIGRIDGLFSFPFIVEANNIQADAQQKIVGDELMFTDIHYLFNKDDEKLAAAIDDVIVQLIDDGTVGELLVEWFGEDYSPQLK